MTPSKPLRIGVDFDNTIVSYDKVFYDEALRKSWIEPDTAPLKKAVKAQVLLRFSNDEWTELQGIVYGRGIARAGLHEGFWDFALWAQSRGHALFVVSLKTEFAASGEKIPLRALALRWLEERRFFAQEGLGLDPKRQVFFENTLKEKIARIRGLGLTHFVDDHLDVLLDPDFPAGVVRVHYDAAQGERSAEEDFFSAKTRVIPECDTPRFWGMSFTTWKAIRRFLTQVE